MKVDVDVDVERRKKGRVAKNFLGSKRDGLELDWLDVEECEVLYGIFNIGREGGWDVAAEVG